MMFPHSKTLAIQVDICGPKLQGRSHAAVGKLKTQLDIMGYSSNLLNKFTSNLKSLAILTTGRQRVIPR